MVLGGLWKHMHVYFCSALLCCAVLCSVQFCIAVFKLNLVLFPFRLFEKQKDMHIDYVRKNIMSVFI